MCGRYVLQSKASLIEKQYQVVLSDELKMTSTPRYNIAPGQGILAVWDDRDAGKRLGDYFVWGLVPGWVKDPNGIRPQMNARSETMGEKASFRDSARYRRCIVPADGFYEWKRRGREREPYYFSLNEGGLMGLAAIWSHWASPDGSEIMSIAILTTAANGVMAPIHDRQPVIIDQRNLDRWLDPMESRIEAIEDLVAPIEDNKLFCYPVGKAVNSGRTDGPELIERLKAPEGGKGSEMDFMDQLFGKA